MAISGTYSDGDAIQMNNCEVEVDLTPASSSFANIDSWATEVVATDEQVNTAYAYTFTHTGPIVFAGNPQPVTVTVTCVYTEGTTDPYHNIKNKSLGSLVDTRWGPAGAGSGGKAFTTSGGVLKRRTLPQGNAEGTNPVVFSFDVECSSVSMGTIA
jgi:hypothetical protein